MQIQRVTDIVQAQGMRQLGIKQTHHMAPGRERAGFLVYTRVARQPGNKMRRNPVAKLRKNAEFGTAWLRFGFFHPLPCGRVKLLSQAFFTSGHGMPVKVLKGLKGKWSSLATGWPRAFQLS